MTAEETTTRRSPRGHAALAPLGSLCQRAAVGHGARGLQRERRPLGIPHPRSGTLARLSLGRGRHRGHLRRRAAALLRACALERRRPLSQGADVRPDRQPGQPRRGRQGVLLLPRQRAQPRLHEVPLQVSAAGVSVCGSRRREPAPHSTGPGVRTARYWHLRRRPLLRRVRGVCEGGARGHPDPRERGQPRTRGGDLARAADALVHERLDVVSGHGETAHRGRPL